MKEIQAMFLNCWLFENKKTGTPTLGINYLINSEDAKIDNDKSKGVQVNSYFTEQVEIFGKFSKNDAMQPIMLTIESVPSPYNMLKTEAKIKRIKTKNAVIDLL